MQSKVHTGPVIWVEGIIGAGKSTLTRTLAEDLQLRGMYEPVDSNPYLDRFYRDPKRWAFPMQMELLMRRYAMQQQAAWEAASESGYRGAILDRGLPGDRVFCRLQMLDGHISELEWETYDRAFNIMTCSIVPPSMLIFLDVAPEVALRRVRERDRDVEKDLPLRYLEKLYSGYLDLLVEIESGVHAWSRGIQVVRVPWNTDHLSPQRLIDMLRDKYRLFDDA